MNKFNEKYNSIKKILLEGTNLNIESEKCYIELSINFLNEKELCNKNISFEEIKQKSKMYEVLVEDISESSKDQTIRITGKNKQELIEFLSTFIKDDKVDYVSTFILREGESPLDKYLNERNPV